MGLDIMSLRLRLSTPRFVDAGWDILPEYTAAGFGSGLREGNRLSFCFD